MSVYQVGSIVLQSFLGDPGDITIKPTEKRGYVEFDMTTVVAPTVGNYVLKRSENGEHLTLWRVTEVFRIGPGQYFGVMLDLFAEGKPELDNKLRWMMIYAERASKRV